SQVGGIPLVGDRRERDGHRGPPEPGTWPARHGGARSASRSSILCCEVISGRFCCADREESAMKKYRVTLTADERESLAGLIATGKAAAKKLTHARILLKADQADGSPGWIDEQLAEALEVSVATVERARQRFVE